MTKEEFFRLLNNLDSADQQEIDQLENILREHPYFQIAPILQAKIAVRINSLQKSSYITKAALYTADRANLKNFIEDRIVLAQPVIEEKKEQDFIPVEKDNVTAADIRKIVEEIQTPTEPSASDNLYKEVMKNLATLKSLREKYEFLEEKEKEEVVEEQETTSQPETTSEKGDGKTKKNSKPAVKKTLKKEKSKPEETSVKAEEPLPKIDIEEQNTLIETFIKNESQFSKKKPDINIENKDDLSEKSTTISDEIISENLAEIMLHQGKADKAIEIYKKLIWKFPQKKAYFASRIEELTNK